LFTQYYAYLDPILRILVALHCDEPLQTVILENNHGFWHKTRTKYDFSLIEHVIIDYFANIRKKIVLCA